MGSMLPKLLLVVSLCACLVGLAGTIVPHGTSVQKPPLGARLNGSIYAEGLAYRLLMNEKSGSPYDLVSGRQLTLLGASWEPAGVYFDGSSDYGEDVNFSWPTGGPVTVSMWVNIPGTSGTASGFTVGGDFDEDRFHAHMPYSDSVLYWDYGSIASGRVSLNIASYFGQWIYLVLVSEGVGGSFQGIYIDGRLVASQAGSDGPDAPLTGIELARDTSSGTQEYTCASFAIYDRVLTAGQIRHIRINPYADIHSPLNAALYYQSGAPPAAATRTILILDLLLMPLWGFSQ